jgi:hypothetical protein
LKGLVNCFYFWGKVRKSFYQFFILKHRQILKHSRFLKHSLKKLSLLKKFQSLLKRFTFHFGFTSFLHFSLLVWQFTFWRFTGGYWVIGSSLYTSFGNPRWQGLQLKAALFSRFHVTQVGVAEILVKLLATTLLIHYYNISFYLVFNVFYSCNLLRKSFP